MAPSRRAVAIACNPATPGAHHQHARRLDRAGRGHHHRKGAAELVGGVDDRLVAGEVRLRGQHIHRLRAGDPRQQLDREGADPGRGIGLGRGRVLQRLQQADQHRAAFKIAEFVELGLAGGQRALHLEHDVGVAEHRRRIRRDRRAGRGKGRIGDAGCFAGAAFGDDLEPHRQHPLDGVGRGRDAALMRPSFLDDGNLHRAAVPECAGRRGRTMQRRPRFVKCDPGQRVRHCAVWGAAPTPLPYGRPAGGEAGPVRHPFAPFRRRANLANGARWRWPGDIEPRPPQAGEPSASHQPAVRCRRE